MDNGAQLAPSYGALRQARHEHSSFTFSELAGLLWQRRNAVASVSAIVTCAVLFGSFLITPMYEATATLGLEHRAHPVNFDQSKLPYDPYMGSYEYDLLNTQRDILRSPGILQIALQKGGLANSPAYLSSNDPVAMLERRLFTTTQKETWVIITKLRDEDPRRAENGLQALLTGFLDTQAARNQARNRNTIEFLQNQAADAQRKLQKARADEAAFRNAKGLSITILDSSVVAQRVRDMNNSIIELRNGLAGSARHVAQILAADAITEQAQRLNAYLAIPTIISTNPGVRDQQHFLFEMQIKEKELSQKYLEKHPRMIEIREELRLKEDQFRQSIEQARSMILSDYKRRQGEVESLAQRIQEADQQLVKYQNDLTELHTLEEQTANQAKLYQQILQQLSEAEVTARFDQQAIYVADNPRAGPNPVNIYRGVFVLIAILFGLVCGFVTPLAMDVIERRVNGQEVIKAITSAPILGTIPWTETLAPSLADVSAESLSIQEAFRTLRTSLGFITAQHEGCRCILVTSPTPGDGKSAISLRLAASLAAAGARVLLVDADLRQPSLQRSVGSIDERGLSLLLIGEPDISPIATAWPNLSFLGSGPCPPNPSELLNSHCLPEWVTHSRQFYDYLVVDSAPLAACADALVLANSMDHVLLVVRDQVTAKADLIRSLELLAPVNSKLLGLILNARREAGQERYAPKA